MFVSTLLTSACVPPIVTAAKADENLTGKVKSSLRQAIAYLRSIATNGGYVGIYSVDLQDRFGEAFRQRAQATEIWIQPPGTPSLGEVFLRAYKITKDGESLKAAGDVGRALAWGQRIEGGWSYLVDVGHMVSGSPVQRHPRHDCTFDDNTSQAALSFLMKLDEISNKKWLSDSIELGLEFLLRSQFPNGAWPQWYRLQGGYRDYYTFNDRAINDCIRVLLEAHRYYGRARYFNGAKRGGQFIIASQLAQPQAGWAQQYSHDLKPAWARAFEPPGVCSWVTSDNIHTLVDLYRVTGDRRYLKPIPDAIDWLQRSKLAPGWWALLYEIGTNRPIYGDYDGKVHYTLGEISQERLSYGWQCRFGVVNAIQYYEAAKQQSSFSSYPQPPRLTADERRIRAKVLAPRVQEMIRQQDRRGRWIDDDGFIRTKTFVENMNQLCEYLEVTS
jgi:Pectic acid lyase